MDHLDQSTSKMARICEILARRTREHRATQSASTAGGCDKSKDVAGVRANLAALTEARDWVRLFQKGVSCWGDYRSLWYQLAVGHAPGNNLAWYDQNNTILNALAVLDKYLFPLASHYAAVQYLRCEMDQLEKRLARLGLERHIKWDALCAMRDSIYDFPVLYSVGTVVRLYYKRMNHFRADSFSDYIRLGKFRGETAAMYNARWEKAKHPRVRRGTVDGQGGVGNGVGERAGQGGFDDLAMTKTFVSCAAYEILAAFVQYGVRTCVTESCTSLSRQLDATREKCVLVCDEPTVLGTIERELQHTTVIIQDGGQRDQIAQQTRDAILGFLEKMPESQRAGIPFNRPTSLDIRGLVACSLEPLKQQLITCVETYFVSLLGQHCCVSWSKDFVVFKWYCVAAPSYTKNSSFFTRPSNHTHELLGAGSSVPPVTLKQAPTSCLLQIHRNPQWHYSTTK